MSGGDRPNIDRIADEGMRFTDSYGEQSRPTDRSAFIPTVHGVDEFFGNLYHLNAEEDPESPNYPPPADFPHFRELFNLRTDPFRDFPPRQKAASQ